MTGAAARRRPDFRSVLMAGVLFVCLFTSANWLSEPPTARGEVLRLDRILLFGQLTVYHLLAGLMFAAAFFAKFAPGGGVDPRRIAGPPSFLKTLFWLFLVPLNILIYLTVVVKAIRLKDFGVAPIVEFGLYLVVIYFIQDIYLEGRASGAVKSGLTLLQVLIALRLVYSIVKYALGYGMPLPGGGVRLGQEDDFADFFVLLFIAGLSRLLFETGEKRLLRGLHAAGAGLAFLVAIVSMRRYFQVEILIALGLILAARLRLRRERSLRPAIGAGLALSLVFGAWLFVGPRRMAATPAVGRLLTSFSLISDRYAGRFGTDTGHRAEIRDGWLNVRAHWLLGVTPFGLEKIRKVETRTWQPGYFVHNAYLWFWMIYGIFGLILFLAFYGLSLRLGAILFLRHGSSLGLVLAVFLICQLVKNIVWVTAFYFMNMTIVYLFLVSLAWKAEALARAEKEAGGAGGPGALCPREAAA
jgi:hypothetical protein